MKQLYYGSSKTKFIKSEYLRKHCFLPETFEALLSSEDKKSSALASFNLARSGKLLKIYVRYNGSHNLGLYKSGFIYLTLSSSAKTGQSYICESQRRSGYQGSESIAANKASFRSSQFDWIFGFTFAVAIPISQRAS